MPFLEDEVSISSRTVFVNVLVSLFRAYLNTKILTAHKELRQGNEDLGPNI